MAARLSGVGEQITIKYRLVDDGSIAERAFTVPISRLRGPLEDAVYTEAVAHVFEQLHIQITNLPEILNSVAQDAFCDVDTNSSRAAITAEIPCAPCAISRNATQPIDRQSIQDILEDMTTKLQIARGSHLLFLDDDRGRHKAFSRVVTGCAVSYVFSAEQAIALLESETFDAAFLDHDLCDEDIMSTPGQPTVRATGAIVATHIAKMASTKRPGVVIVHSMNPVGAVHMERTLSNAGTSTVRLPFDRMLLAVDVI